MPSGDRAILGVIFCYITRTTAIDFHCKQREKSPIDGLEKGIFHVWIPTEHFSHLIENGTNFIPFIVRL